MAKQKRRQYVLTPHVCRCGGRVLADVTPGLVTGGGNQLWRCASCEIAAATITCAWMCWCRDDPTGALCRSRLPPGALL